MNIKREIKQIKNKLEQIEKELNKSTTIDDIKIGEQFKYKGHNYTKLNNNNYCIIDDYDNRFMRCVFDPISNNYEESVVRQYINSDKFTERLGIDVCDLKTCYNGEDCITLLSKTEYECYGNNIRDYVCWWMTRSSSSTYDNTFCCIYNGGSILNDYVLNTYSVRVCFILKPNTPVTRKCDEE